MLQHCGLNKQDITSFEPALCTFAEMVAALSIRLGTFGRDILRVPNSSLARCPKHWPPHIPMVAEP